MKIQILDVLICKSQDFEMCENLKTTSEFLFVNLEM